jgi:hypothetical protein
VSHLAQRKEKNCLNCGTITVGRYCHNCGQENTDPKESVWHLITHFFNDVTHFDGKFFSTLKILLFRPGFLSREYMSGRRALYLNPVRMYIFTSFLFFLIFFSMVHVNPSDGEIEKFTFNGKTEEMIDSMPGKEFNDFTKTLNGGKPMTRAEFDHYRDSIKAIPTLIIFGNGKDKRFQSKEQYDSALRTGNVKDGWIQRMITYKQIEINDEYKHKRTEFVTDFINSFLHHFPQVLFISLPLVALFLKLLYTRRKKFYYVSHAIFTIHLYVFIFIMMLATMLISKLQSWLNWGWIGYINGVLTLLIFFYLYKAMRNFYQQRRGKTILKYFLFNISFFILIIFLFLIFGIISVFQI